MEPKLFGEKILPAVTLLAAIAASPAQAATVTFNYGVNFGSVTPDGPAPYATAVFDDGGGSGSVTLTMAVAASVNLADITQMYFNVDPTIDPTLLTFNRDSGTGPTAANTTIQTGVDAFQADGDGLYDILFNFPPHTTTGGTQADRFNAGENLVYTITGTGITASSFNYFATPGPGEDNAGPFLSAAQFQDTGPSQLDSDWVGAVPVPAAVWLFGSGLLGLVGMARRKKT